jgi:hypothetical protein
MSGVLSTLRASALLTAIVIVACLPSVAVEWLTARQPRSPAVAYPAERSSSIAADGFPALPPAPPEGEYEPVSEYDLRGNEILRPVERYSIDHRGTLYELHSPQTEIPRLSPPEL